MIYYNPDLILQMIVNKDIGMGQDVAAHTGLTTVLEMPSEKSCPGTISWIAAKELCPSLPPWQNKYSPQCVLRLGSVPSPPA